MIEKEKQIKLEEEIQIKKDKNAQGWKKYEKFGGECCTKEEIKTYILPILKYKIMPDTHQKKHKIESPYETVNYQRKQ